MTKSKKAVEISKKLLKSFGLIDKIGNITDDPRPVDKFKKRRSRGEKRLKPKKK